MKASGLDKRVGWEEEILTDHKVDLVCDFLFDPVKGEVDE
jgi:hypothetical protein